MTEGRMNWAAFWDQKAAQPTDFQATGRSVMSMADFLFAAHEVHRILDLARTDRLADIGCGSGLFCLALVDHVSRIDAVDISPAMVERARHNIKGIDTVCVNVGAFPDTGLPAESYEKVLAYSVLQYLSGPDEVEAAFHSTARLLKRGGRALFACNPDPDRRERYTGYLHDTLPPDRYADSLTLLDQTLWHSPEDMIRTAEKAGLSARMLPIHHRIWQHFYMFDLIVEKP